MAAMFSKHDPLEHKNDSINDTVDTVVGPSVVVEGDFVSNGNIVVKGVVSGNVRTSQHLLVEEGAKIMANVKARSAEVSGEISGNVKVKETLELTSSAKVLGDIECGTLIVAGGAGLAGKCITAAVDFSSLKNEKKDEKKTKNNSLRRAKKSMEHDGLEVADAEPAGAVGI